MKANKMIKTLQKLNNQEEDCEVIVHIFGQEFSPAIRRGIKSDGKKFILINLLRMCELNFEDMTLEEKLKCLFDEIQQLKCDTSGLHKFFFK